MVILHKKLKRLKVALKSFNPIHFARISDKVKVNRSELESIQISILSNSFNAAMLGEEKRLSNELHDLVAAEGSLYRQKSRVQWIQEGDLNTKFFHSMVMARQK